MHETATESYSQNGHGNGHSKAFGIVPKVDPDTLTAVHIREQACEDAQLGNGAVRLFCRLIDLALNPDWYRPGQKGQVLIGQMKLATLLNCSERTIRTWTQELLTQRYVWITRVPRPNTKPVIRYHVSAFIAPKQTLPDVRGEGAIGNCRRRWDADLDREPNRAANGKFRRLGGLLLDQFGKPYFSNLLGNAGESGQRLPVRAAEFTRESGEKLPVRAAENCRSERKESAALNGKKLPLPAEEIRRSHRSEAADIKETQLESESNLSVRGDGNDAPPPVSELDPAFKNWVKGLEGSYPSRLEKLRTKFVEQRKRASESGKALLDRKLQYLDLLLDGPQPEYVAPKKAGPARALPRPELQSEEQLLEGVRYAIEVGKLGILTEAQRAAGRKAGLL